VARPLGFSPGPATRAAGTDWGLGAEAHARALLSEDDVAKVCGKLGIGSRTELGGAL
jgi:hypothetical protein